MVGRRLSERRLDIGKMEERKKNNPRPLSVAVVVAGMVVMMLVLLFVLLLSGFSVPEDMVEPLIMGIEDEAKKGSPSPRSLEERNY